MASARINAALGTYSNAVAVLHGRASRKIANNTYLVPVHEPEGVAVRLHSTYIVIYCKNGDIVLNSGGWRTMTTRARIDDLLPSSFRLWAVRGQWFIHEGGNAHLFRDGMRIKKSGKLSGAGNMAEFKRNQRLRDQVKRYAEGYTRALFSGKVPAPSGGDCWHCLMQPENQRRDYHGIKGGTVGAVKSPFGSDHIKGHMKEKYYVPSLLVRALETMGASDMDKYESSLLMHGKPLASRWSEDLLKKNITKYIRRYILREFGMSY